MKLLFSQENKIKEIYSKLMYRDGCWPADKVHADGTVHAHAWCSHFTNHPYTCLCVKGQKTMSDHDFHWNVTVAMLWDVSVLSLFNCALCHPGKTLRSCCQPANWSLYNTFSRFHLLFLFFFVIIIILLFSYIVVWFVYQVATCPCNQNAIQNHNHGLAVASYGLAVAYYGLVVA